MTPRRWAFLRIVFGTNELKPKETDVTETAGAWWKDAAERLVWTFLQGALAILTAEQFGLVDLVDGDLWRAAAGGGIGAALSFIKSLAATRLSAGDTAQLGATTYSYTEAGPGSAG